MKSPYLPRVVDTILERNLASAGAVLVEGPKFCGKTRTAQQKAHTVFRLDTDTDARAAAELAPSVILDAQPPVLIDEWQFVPSIWDQVRHAVDERSPEKGMYILAGSSVPNDDARRHSGAGRIVTLPMRTMSFLESEHSTGVVSLREIFDGKPIQGAGRTLELPEVLERILVGGWPQFAGENYSNIENILSGYIDNAVEVDVPKLGGVAHDPVKLLSVMRSLARNVATEVADADIARDAGVDRSSVVAYTDTLQRLRLVENQPAWNTHIRSRTSLRQAPKRHFSDPSLAGAVLGISPERLLGDLRAAGFYFESQVVHDLRIYAQPLRGNVYHYRDGDGLEVDAIVELRSGDYIACEVKLGYSRVEEGVASLQRFAQKMAKRGVQAPVAMMVVVPSGLGYTREDGVHVVPLTALGV